MSDPLSLPDTPWISSLRADDRELLKAYGEFISARPEVPLLAEGQPQNNLYLVISGTLTVKRQTDLGDATVATIGPGESIGEIALFDVGPASATVTATEFCQLWRINREELLNFVTDNQGAGIELVMGLAATLAQRLRSAGPLGPTPLETGGE